MHERHNDTKLISILRLAYSGELAAAFAYRGHWHSVADEDERNQIKTIEEEEWHHRKLVGEMLRSMGSQPSVFREFRAAAIGRMLGVLCQVTGWFLPMYAKHKTAVRARRVAT
jgi:demethoxyubiquinone hydroxylase (CLK1/Coq7/Cat5 family)